MRELAQSRDFFFHRAIFLSCEFLSRDFFFARKKKLRDCASSLIDLSTNVSKFLKNSRVYINNNNFKKIVQNLKELRDKDWSNKLDHWPTSLLLKCR